MKILKRVLIGVFIVFIVILVILSIFVATFNIEKYKPKIIELAQNSINRKVSIDKLSLFMSLPLNVGLKITGFVISDDEKFSKDAFCKLAEISATADLLPLILKREIKIAGISLINPELNLIIDENGKMNIPLPAVQPAAVTGAKPAAAIPAAIINRFNIKNGQVNFKIKNVAPQQHYEVAEIDFTATNITLGAPIDFKGRINILSDKQNLDFAGRIRVNLTPQEFIIENFVMDTDLSNINPDKIKSTLPQLSALKLKDKISGRINIVLEKAVLSENKVSDLKGQVKLTNGSLATELCKSALSAINLNARLDKQELFLDGFLAKFASGDIQAVGNIKNILLQPKFEINAGLNGLNIDELIAQANMPVEIKGKINAKMHIAASGLTPQQFQNSLTGEGNLSIDGARLVNLNILRTVFDKMSMLPGLVASIEANLPQNYRDILRQNDTIFKKIELETNISQNKLNILKATIETDVFNMEGTGWVDFLNTINLIANLYIAGDLSQSMVALEEKLKFLQVEDNRILIPLAVTGVIPNVQVMPDLEYLAKKLLIAKGQELIGNILNKALKNTATQGENSQSPQEGQAPQEAQPTIEGIFKNIFGK